MMYMIHSEMLQSFLEEQGYMFTENHAHFLSLFGDHVPDGVQVSVSRYEHDGEYTHEYKLEFMVKTSKNGSSSCFDVYLKQDAILNISDTDFKNLCYLSGQVHIDYVMIYPWPSNDSKEHCIQIEFESFHDNNLGGFNLSYTNNMININKTTIDNLMKNVKKQFLTRKSK